METITQEGFKGDINQQMELMLKNSLGGRSPGEIVKELFSNEGIERLRGQIEIPEIFLIPKSGQNNVSTGVGKNFFNSMHKLTAQQLLLAGKFSELARVRESPAYGIYVRARDTIKGFFGAVEKYDAEKILDRQLTNLEICNESVSSLLAYSRGELSVLRNKGIYRLLEMGGGQKQIDLQKGQIGHKKQVLNEVRQQIPAKPWGENDMIRVALAEALGHSYDDSVDRLSIYEVALREIAKDKKFVTAIERMLRSSTTNLEKLLVRGLSTARSIRDIKPALEIMKAQGLVGKVQEKQIIDIGESSLELYTSSGLSCKSLYGMVQDPAIERYRSYMSGSFGEFMNQERGIDLDNLDYISKL